MMTKPQMPLVDIESLVDLFEPKVQKYPPVQRQTILERLISESLMTLFIDAIIKHETDNKKEFKDLNFQIAMENLQTMMFADYKKTWKEMVVDAWIDFVRLIYRPKPEHVINDEPYMEVVAEGLVTLVRDEPFPGSSPHTPPIFDVLEFMDHVRFKGSVKNRQTAKENVLAVHLEMMFASVIKAQFNNDKEKHPIKSVHPLLLSAAITKASSVIKPSITKNRIFSWDYIYKQTWFSYRQTFDQTLRELQTQKD